MTAKKTHWLRNSILIVLAFAIVGLALTSYLFFTQASPTCATANLEFTFEGAAEGIAPNNTAFNLDDITSEAVLSAALQEAGLEGNYTVEQLQGSLLAQGVYPDDISQQAMSYDSLLDFSANRRSTLTDYHPTTFNIRLDNRFDPSISKTRLVNLLRSILTAYKAHFARVYANGIQKEMAFSLDTYDYGQQLESIQNRYSELADYASELYERHPSFLYSGSSFNDISSRLNNLVASDVMRTSANLTINALSRDPARLIIQYQFEIRQLSNQQKYQTERLEKIDALIDSYDKSDILYVSNSNNNLTRISGDSSETYDTLMDQRKTVADNISRLDLQIADCQLKLASLMGTEDSDEAASSNPSGTEASAEETSLDYEDIAAAAATRADENALTGAQAASIESSIQAILQKGDAIIDEFSTMLTAFNGEQISDATITDSGYKFVTPTVLSGAFIKKAIMTAGPFCAIGFMLCMVLIIRSRRREEKQR